jgi:hypothetical protein
MEITIADFWMDFKLQVKYCGIHEFGVVVSDAEVRQAAENPEGEERYIVGYSRKLSKLL